MEFKRKPVVEAMRELIGTRFHHGQRLAKKPEEKKGGGTDCVGAIILTANKFNYHIEDQVGYSHNPSSLMFMTAVEKHLDKIEFEDVKEADLLVFSFGLGREPQHIAMVSKTQPMTIIHAYSRARQVTEHVLTDEWKNGTIATLKGVYRFRGIKD